MPPPFLRLPLLVLEEIALAVATADAPGLPRDIVPLLQTCRAVHTQLAFAHNNYLYARLFRAMFDTLAPRRRLGDDVLFSAALAEQLRTYCTALRRIRLRERDAAVDTLWAAFFMLMEDDGRNGAQLARAGLRAYVDGFVRGQLMDRAEESHGWPAESTANALALCLLWHTSDCETLQNEPADARREIMERVRPFVVNPVRYAPFHTPDTHFVLPVPPDFQHAYTHRTPQGLYPPYRAPTRTLIRHFGRTLAILPPNAAQYAKLVYFARTEAVGFPIPGSLHENREVAVAAGALDPAPTQEDLRVFNEHKAAVPPAPAAWDWLERLSPEEREREMGRVWEGGMRSTSACRDVEWNRMRWCFNPRCDPPEKGVVYALGSIAGQWMGRSLMPDATEYFDMVKTLGLVAHRPRMITLPIAFRLREHHCLAPATPAPHGGAPARPMLDDGIANGWFPEHTAFASDADGATAITPGGGRHHYETYTGKERAHDARCEACASRAEEERRELEGRMVYLDTALPELASGADSEEVEEARGVVEEALGVDADAVISDELCRGGAPAVCNGVKDIIVTGESLPKHSQAWHLFRFYGRIRRWDGLLALVRVPVGRADLGVAVFRGYVVEDKLVGTWRAWTSVGALPLEGPFVASRAPEAE